MLIRLFFKILTVYAVWQLFRMVFAMNKAQKKMQNDLNDMGNAQNRASNGRVSRDRNEEGEYIDYEEIK